MKKVNVVMVLVLFGFSLMAVAASYAADSEQGRRQRAAPTTPAQQQTISTPAAPTAGETPGGSSGPGPGSFTGGCCQKPTPFPGWDCCDTRDCGWMKCGDAASMPPKKYR